MINTIGIFAHKVFYREHLQSKPEKDLYYEETEEISTAP
jgi:hypothetical protein